MEFSFFQIILAHAAIAVVRFWPVAVLVAAGLAVYLWRRRGRSPK
jgi:hypothetical protein